MEGLIAAVSPSKYLPRREIFLVSDAALAGEHGSLSFRTSSFADSQTSDSRRCQHEEAKQPRLTRHAVHKNAGKHRVDLTPDARFDAACFDRGPLLDDSSAAEDVREPSPAPAPDAGITYSFDAPRGASRGGEVLSEAISQAVDRYERRETQKLVDREYDVVDKGEDEEHGGYVADEDDYELV